MKTIFPFDLDRGYQPNDINNYRKIIQRLASSYPWNYEIRQETVKNSHEEWIKLQNSTFHGRHFEQLNYNYQYCKFADLYIFFEAPELFIKEFRRRDIKYLNFMTSKIRFPGLEDTITVESNLDIGQSLTDDELKSYIPQNITYRHNIYDQFSDKTIVIGQMYDDRSVIFDGKSHSIFDYEFKADIYRPHPHAVLYQPEFHKQQVELAKQRGLEVIQEGNIYQILHSCKKVVGFSSSTLYEAELMGKEVDFLNEKSYIKKGKMIWWNQINETFWEHIRSQV